MVTSTYFKEYYLKNRDALLAYKQSYYQKNKERFFELNKVWKKNNRERYLKNRRNWNRKNLGCNPNNQGNSTFGIGRRGELIAAKILEGSVDLNVHVAHQQHDLLWNGYTINVKTAHYFRKQWYFNIGHSKTRSDYYFCVCLLDEKPLKFYLVPNEIFGCSLTIGPSDKHEKYCFNL